MMQRRKQELNSNSVWSEVNNHRIRMGIVADDVTGANDIGIMFAKNGCKTHVYSIKPASQNYEISPAFLPDIAILNTNSRLDLTETAYTKVYQATSLLQAMGCKRFYKKTCSVFRGNIGTEFDAMLDALQSDFAVVIAGFPKNGRITKNGIHYVHGKKLENSEFRKDPVHPTHNSDLVKILELQTDRKVGLIDYQTVDKGSLYLQKAILSKKDHFQYIIIDVVDQNALKIIARAVRDESVLCGSSALGEELPDLWEIDAKTPKKVDLPKNANLGILVVSGSLMPQTLMQVENLCDKGVTGFELLPEVLYDVGTRENHIESLSKGLTRIIKDGSDAILFSTKTDEKVKLGIQKGLDYGYSTGEIFNLVSEVMARITARVIRATGQNRLIIAGGETSAAVCESLAIYGMEIWKEIQPGLPSCISLSEPRKFLVLKSGSFGKPDFFEKALTHLRLDITG